MKVDEFLSLVNFSEQARETFFQNALSEDDYIEKKEEYYRDEQLFLNRLKQEKGGDYYKALLYYFTRFAVDLYQTYLEKGFSREEYIDTFSDLKTWNEMCILESGICGLKETGWLTSHLHAGIVTFGRLQFQPEVLEEDLIVGNLKVNKGEEILNIHIPFGGALDPLEVDKSFERARQHFGNKYIHIETWLADPNLKKYLKENSNILSFVSRFNLYKLEESNSIERFIFKVVKENKQDYVATSSFANAIKQALIRGEKFYSGFALGKL